MPLSDEQSRQYNRMSKLDIFFEHEGATADLYAPMKLEKDDFRKNFKNLTDALPDKNTVTTGITKDKNELKADVGHSGDLICNLTHAFAVKFNHNELASQVNFGFDKIYKLKDSAILAFAIGIKTAVTPFLGDANFTDYGIKAPMLDDLVKEAESFTTMIGKAKEGATHNTVGNTEIDKIIKRMIGNIDTMDKLVMWFQKDYAKFVEGYHLNSTLDNTGVRHNGIEGVAVNEAGEPLANVVVRLRGTHYEAVTDLMGVFRLTKVKAGDYIVDVTAEGYKALEELHHIKVRRVEEVKFVMKKG